MKIKFLGASGMVTGSSYLLDERILVDLGMFQGTKEIADLNRRPLEFSCEKLEYAVVTHAHLDHCGRLPLLTKGGFSGAIYMTEATRELVDLVLQDAAKIVIEDNDQAPMYLEEDVVSVMARVKVVGYDERFNLGEGVEGVFRDAGHILGSASVEILGGRNKIIFSGDLGNTPQEIIRPTEFIHQGEVVIMESTYGDRSHGEEDPAVILEEEVREIEKTGGALLIPAFAMERTQELLHLLDHLKRRKKIKETTAVYLDSPMAIRATEIFKKHRELFNKEMIDHIKKDDDPFDFPGLVVVEGGHDSRQIAKTPGAKVIIAGSGMMSGGRMVAHAGEFLSIETTRLLFVGYQAVGTLGRFILEGKKKRDNGESLYAPISGEQVEVKANIREVTSMSAHADREQLIVWLKKIRGVKQVFLTHGEQGREALSEVIKKELGITCRLPVLDEEFVI